MAYSLSKNLPVRYRQNNSAELYVTPPTENHTKESKNNFSNSSSLSLSKDVLKYQQLLKQVEHLQNVNQELRTQQQQATIHAKNVSSYQRCPNLSKDIARNVKYEVFREIKFITSQEELDDLDQPNSIGNKVLEMFPIAPEDKWMFWNTYKGVVKKAIATRCNDVNNAIQKVVVAMFKANEDKKNKMAYDYSNKVSQSIINNKGETNSSDSITFDYSDDEKIDVTINNIPANENSLFQ